jgi:hypothetical protein
MHKLFAAFLALCLLMQVNAGMAMQVNMVFAAKVSNTLQAHSTQAMPPCHTDGAQIVSQDSSTVQHHHCSQCCVPALIPAVVTFKSVSTVHPAPVAALFNSLPAPAQRPVKPPLV